MRHFIFGFGIIVFCSVVSGEQLQIKLDDMKRDTLTASPPTSQPPLDLKTAVKRAIDNNNAIQQARAKIEQSKYDTSSTQALLFPNLSFVASTTDQKGGGISTSPAPFDGKIYHQYNADVKLNQPLFAWGSLAAIRVSDFTTKLNQIDLEVAERDLTSNVIQAFYKVLLNQRLLEILERIQKVVNESLATAQSRLRTGRGQLLDVLQVKTQIALLKPQIEDAHNQLESAGAQLATYLAEEGKYELKLTGSLKGLLLKDIQRRLSMKEARLPELERVRFLREQLDETKDVVAGKYLPTLALLGDYGTNNFSHFDVGTENSPSWSVMLQLTVPIFNGFQSIDQRRSLGEQDRQLAFQGRDVENTLALNQVQSLKALQSTGASLVSAEEAANLADQSMAEARRNYRLATIDFIQFLTVQQSALQADSSLDNIRYNNIVALTKYFVATGQPLHILVDSLVEGK